MSDRDRHRSDRAQFRSDRARDKSDRARDRSDRAQDRSDTAQDRSVRARGRSDRAGDRSARSNRAQDRSLELGIGLIELGIGLMELGIGLRINNAWRTVMARVCSLVVEESLWVKDIGKNLSSCNTTSVESRNNGSQGTNKFYCRRISFINSIENIKKWTQMDQIFISVIGGFSLYWDGLYLGVTICLNNTMYCQYILKSSTL